MKNKEKPLQIKSDVSAEKDRITYLMDQKRYLVQEIQDLRKFLDNSTSKSEYDYYEPLYLKAVYSLEVVNDTIESVNRILKANT